MVLVLEMELELEPELELELEPELELALTTYREWCLCVPPTHTNFLLHAGVEGRGVFVVMSCKPPMA